MLNLTVFCSSKINIHNNYFNQSRKLISLLDPKKINLVYGGGTTGLMGCVRNTWLENNGNLITSNMKKFAEKGIEDTYLFDNINDRQKKLVELGDIYLALPGGYGTHYEVLEVMTNNDIKEANKPIFILNTNNIFDNLLFHIKNLHEEGFVTRNLDEINVFVSSEPEDIANKINNYNK